MQSRKNSSKKSLAVLLLLTTSYVSATPTSTDSSIEELWDWMFPSEPELKEQVICPKYPRCPDPPFAPEPAEPEEKVQ